MKNVNVLKQEINISLGKLRKLIHDEEKEIPLHLQQYEFYQHGELIMVGTMNEIQRYTGYAAGTLTGFSQPAYLRKNKDKPVSKIIKIQGGSI